MEGGVTEKPQPPQSSSTSGSSYTYWVREKTAEAAPQPVPRKLSVEDISKQHTNSGGLGSAWNHAGTWEEKNLNSWANSRIKELLSSMDAIEFSNGSAKINEVSKCVGDAFLVTVRNKKRVGYTYELTLNFKGEWAIGEEKQKIKGYVDVPEFTFGELEDLQVEVRISEDKGLTGDDKFKVIKDIKNFLPAIRDKLLAFEQELKDR